MATKQMPTQVKFIQIAVSGGGVPYGLDAKGQVWYLSDAHKLWVPITTDTKAVLHWVPKQA